MFSTLESAWNWSARRGWTTLASFGFQAMAVSLLLLVPLIWVQGPPKLTWFETLRFPTPPTAAVAPPTAGEQPHTPASTNLNGTHIVEPGSIPPNIAQLNEQQIQAAPDGSGIGVIGGTGVRGRGGEVWNSIGERVEVAAPPPAPAPTRPLIVSHWAEGNLIYRVQPVYPPLARQARIQGTVQLRAVISRTGTIENLQAISGHPILIPSALNAVRQWRYRPYLLNNNPIEVETEITVNFILSAD